MEDQSVQKPSVYDYLDYRSFLNDMIIYLRSRKLYSTRRFAKAAGFSCANYMKMIIDGKRHLSHSSAEKVAEQLKLRHRESEFLLLLIDFDKAQDIKERDEFFQEILKHKSFRQNRKIDAFQYEYFSKWYVIVLLEALRTDFRFAAPAVMAERLGVSESELFKSLDLLFELGMIEKKAGHWKVKNESFQTSEELAHINARNFHKQMIDKASETVDKIATEYRSLGAITIPLSSDQFQEVKKKFVQFTQDINAIYSQQKGSDAVYQINYQIFPVLELCRPKSADKKSKTSG